MTTTEHLDKILAKLDELLATAEKRTPGEWYVNKLDRRSICYADDNVIGNVRNWKEQSDATFIASCASNAEAGWKATKATIQALNNYSILSEDMEEVRNTILAAWPIESL